MHIGLVIWDISKTRGGVQRVAANLAVGLRDRGHRITVFTNDDGAPAPVPVYPLPADTEVISLHLAPEDRPNRAQTAIVDSNPDVLVAMFSWKDLLWFPWLLKDTGIPLACSEHNYPPIISYERWNPYEHFGCLSAADRIHVLLEGYKDLYPAPLRERITVIPNCMPEPICVDWEQRSQKPVRTIVAAGRFFENQKQFSLLVKTFAALADEFPTWNLEICGDGPDWKSCHDIASALSCADKISLPGAVVDMNSHYAAADLFCIPSRHEGFPMTVGEAAAQGLPLVGFADCPGVNELIIPGNNGILAPEMTAESLTAALRSLMAASADTRRLMGQEAQALAARFDRKSILGQWEQLLEQAAAAKGNTALQRLKSLDIWTIENLMGIASELIGRKYLFRGM